MNRVALAYAGVHQIFQLALAAHEMGELEGLFCSFIDGERKWGRRFGRLVPPNTARPLGSPQIPVEQVTEFPWPLLLNRLVQKLAPQRHSDHLHSNCWFDHAACGWLRASKASIFVGAETCALNSLKQAEAMGMRRVLDCPGVPFQVLDAEAKRAAETFGVKMLPKSVSFAMQKRKELELENADLVLCCSEFQRGSLVALNPQIKKSEVIPLWTDVSFLSGVAEQRRFTESSGILKVLYVGAVSLKKGVPYLLKAVEDLHREVVLTLVGNISAEMTGIMKRFRSHQHIPYGSKNALRELYGQHDVLVMPTLGDSFGFVTIEAMATGLPVIASQNAGAPVPDVSWRVPPHDSDAIRDKLLMYHSDRSLLREDSAKAASFGRTFRPDRYRAGAKKVFKSMLGQ